MRFPQETIQNMTRLPSLRVAVLIPCYNEEVTIGTVVRDFRAALPDARIYVYDNNSSDRTVDIARAAGAIVRIERMQGKGHVVRRMFADVDADYYLLTDGDATYEAAAAPRLIARAAAEGLDLVNGARVTDRAAAYRRGHVLGNRVLTGIVVAIFGRRLSDMLSGYRVFSRRFVKSFPVTSAGFEIETELTVHALELNLPMAEEKTAYRERPEGSASKLRTYQDGFRILGTILKLIQRERPLGFYAVIALAFCVAGLVSGTQVILDFIRTGLVPRLPSAVLATGLEMIAALSLVCGVILHSVAHARQEAKRLAYLMYPVTIRDEETPLA